MRKKIELYGTLGPSDCKKDILIKMFQAGMTGIRLNLSHSDLTDCEPWLSTFYDAAEAMHIVPDLLVDLQGPEVRIGTLSAPLSLQKNDVITFISTEEKNAAKCSNSDFIIPLPSPVFSYLKKGQIIRMDDGKIIAVIEECENAFTARIRTEGVLTSRKSFSIDGISVQLPTLTAKDMEQIKLLSRYRVTGVMLPFVRGKEDLLCLRRALLDEGLSHIRIFAKIENLTGVSRLSAILPHCDHVVIARGDLGNAVPLSRLPAVQKEIARMCLLFKKPFMVVTQMLASMENHPVPTRAEVNDIFHAVLDGASSLMLTGETAMGQYPVEAMQMLSDTAFEAQRYQMEAKFLP